ncbi:hypothetical protein ACIGFK_19240 [Streptomyces sp. NPDC085524]|uniref:hypothetical protein n=1 Tax=Streptomyces sp. NPDC085524 TaxID=3365728 RepID=UPI0037D10437
MSIENDFPEFPYEDPPGWITCRQKPWNGVLVRVDRQSFKAGDKITFDVTVCSDAAGPNPAAKIRGVVSVTADTTSADYTIPWAGVLDAVTEGSITAFYTLTPADGGGPLTSEAAIVDYSRHQLGGT